MIKNKGIIYLSGGGDAKATIDIDYCFVKNISNNEILYIPIAMERDLIGYEACYDWLVNTISRHSEDFIDISMILNLKECKNIDFFSAVYIGGGNTYKLLKEINDSGFSVILKRYVQNGGIVYGGSAGAIILGKNISTVSEENIKYNYNFNDGLSLIGDYSIICHYQENKNKQIIEYLKKYNNPVLAIPEGAGLMIKDDSMTVIGKNPITVFKKNGILENIAPNATLSI